MLAGRGRFIFKRKKDLAFHVNHLLADDSQADNFNEMAGLIFSAAVVVSTLRVDITTSVSFSFKHL